MCFDMTIMDKKNAKLNCSVLRSRRTTRCVVSAAGLRMRPKNPVGEEEEKRGLRLRPPTTSTTVRSKALLRSSKKATIRKQQKRLREVMVCLVEVDRVAFAGRQQAFTRFTHDPPRVPSSAMAPANTTQYLMADVTDDQFDFQPCSVTTTTTTSTAPGPGLYGEGHLSPSSVYVSLDNAADDYETCLAFQQRSFEAELALLYSSC